MTTQYDIAVIGAGPAGLCAAHTILAMEPSIRLALIDKNEGPAQFIACAEGVGRLGFSEVIDCRLEWIRSRITRAGFLSPNNTLVEYSDPNGGYIIDRARMQSDLATECAKNGATMLWKHRVLAVGMQKGTTRVITFDDGTTVSAAIVIDCSGPLSTIGKGEKIISSAPDLEVAYFAVIKADTIDTGIVTIQMGREIAPGGYAWVFPRGDRLNVGIVLGKKYRGSQNIKALLDRFLEKHYPGAVIEQHCAGTIPCYAKRSPMAVHGLIKAGDSASTVNPISRAGIVEAMKCGTLAGEYALLMKAAPQKQHARLCRDYENAWYKKLGGRHHKLAKVKNSLEKVPDADLEKGALAVSSIPVGERTMSKIFTLSVGRFPRLVWALRHLM